MQSAIETALERIREHCRKQNHAAARETAETLLKDKAAPSDVWIAAGAALAACGEKAGAEAQGYAFLAEVLNKLNRPADALQAVERALAIEPNDPERLALKANLLLATNLAGPAIDTYRKALELGPSLLAATGLASILLAESHPADALQILRKAAESAPTSERPSALIAQALTEMGSFDEAAREWAQAEANAPVPADVVLARAAAETAVGRFDVAEELLLRSIEADQRVAESFYLLSRARRMTPSDLPVIQSVERLLDRRTLKDSEAAKLNFALGKSYDDLRDFQRAIRFYDEANRIDYRMYPRRRAFNREEVRNFIDFQVEYFSPERIKLLSVGGIDTELPLFVVGMIRSGTTLTESVLSGHAQVRAGGEQMFWTQRTTEYLSTTPRGLRIDPAAVKRLSHEYLKLIHRRDPAIRYVVDKNPTNVHLAALLHIVFPKAKIVHVKRHPVDNLLSMWMTPMHPEVAYASNRENLVFYYREYLRLVDHLNSVLPEDHFRTVQYEKLTSEPEPTIRSLLSFLGLQPEPACFEPQHNPRTVLTPSVYQVRQPINRGSQERWKNYQPWLGSFAEFLAEAE